jgi:uncharacterized lipoprotein YbaY
MNVITVASRGNIVRARRDSNAGPPGLEGRFCRFCGSPFLRLPEIILKKGSPPTHHLQARGYRSCLRFHSIRAPNVELADFDDWRHSTRIPSKAAARANVAAVWAIAMTLQLTIVSAGGEPLPPGSPMRVELRDTSFADAPAVVVKKIETTVPKTGRTTSVSMPMDLTTVPDGSTVWAHVDVDRDGRVSKGDLISVESYPVTSTTQKTTIRLKKVT